jgi:AAA domain
LSQALRGEDHRTLRQARAELRQLRRELECAEIEASRAFAQAETRSAQHITAQIDELAAELRVLQAAGRYLESRPLDLPAAAVAHLPPLAAAAITRTAGLPFVVTVVHAQPSPERTEALHTLHGAAAAADRTVLWCAPTSEQATAAVDDDLADTATSLADTYTDITAGQRQLSPGTLIVVDDAATADPTMLADLAEHAVATGSGLILLDTGSQTWPPKPSNGSSHS